MIFRSVFLITALIFASAAQSAPCKNDRFEDISFTVCEVDASTQQIGLFLDDAEGQKYGHFSRLDSALIAGGQQLGFAMNAGMYHEDRSPVGHYVENGQERRRVIKGASAGNFGLLPNGIFCVRKGRADVFETNRYLREKPDCRHATQSGPMLVIDGKLHPRFLADSDSRHIRNGVGTSADGRRAVFVISNRAVNFHTFARYFRDRHGLPNALFFDGSVSRLYAPNLDRSDFGFLSMGPIIGLVETRKD